MDRSAPKLSVSEVHLIEAVRKSKDRALTVSEIASELDIAVPSATIAVNKLVKRFYYERKEQRRRPRCDCPAHSEGEKIYRLQRYIFIISL